MTEEENIYRSQKGAKDFANRLFCEVVLFVDGGAIVLMGSLVVNRQLLQLNYSSLFEINSEFSLWRTGQQKWKLEREAFT